MGHQFIQDSYNVEHEVQRKKALNIMLSQSRKQDREEEAVSLVLYWIAGYRVSYGSAAFLGKVLKGTSIQYT